MNFPGDSLELLLFISRFFIGSSAILGAVWLLEKSGLLANRDLADISWKAAIVASLLLLFPASTNFAPQIQLNSQLGGYLVDVLPAQQPDSTKLSVNSNNDRVPQPPAINGSGLENAVPENLAGGQTDMPSVQHSSGLPRFLIVPGILAALMLLSLIVTYAGAVKSLGKRTRVSSDHKAFRLLFEICDRAGIKATPYLTWTDRIDSPLCLPGGEICLPAWALEELPDQELRGLIAHEVAHLKRHDPIVLLALHALTRLFFLQPLLSMAQKRLADLAELAADEWAAQQSDSPRSVAEALFTCAKQITNKKQPQWGLAMARDKSKLRARVERLLAANESHFQSTATWAKTSVAAALLATAMGIPAMAIVAPVPVDHDQHSNADTDSDKDHTGVHISIDTNDNGEQKNGSYQWANNGHAIRAAWDGLYSLNNDDSSLSSVEAHGHFKLSERGNGPKRSIKFTSNNGQLVHSFIVDGDEREMTSQDKKWLHKTLLHFLRTSGSNADQRVTRMLKQDGVSAVLAEIEQTTGHALKLYAKALVKKKKLNSSELKKLLKVLARIESDYDMRQVYSMLLNQGELGKAALKDILAAAKKIESDYEMRQLLSTMLEQQKLDDKLLASLFELSETMESDYELRSLFVTAIEHDGMSIDNLSQLLNVAKTSVESDYELRILISAVAKRFANSAQGLNLAIDAMSSLEGDYEFRVAATSIVKSASLDKAAWLKIIDAVKQIEGDYEAAKALIFMLSAMPADKKLYDQVAKVAEESVESDYEQSKVFKALRKLSKS